MQSEHQNYKKDINYQCAAKLRCPGDKIRRKNNIFLINEKYFDLEYFFKFSKTYIDNIVKNYFLCIFVTSYVLRCHVTFVS